MDPNTQHQRWSEWVFEIHEHGRYVSRLDVEQNIAKWFRMGFGTVGQFKVQRARGAPRVIGWTIRLQIEGVDAHDPAYVASVRQQFRQRFVAQGWGPLACGFVRATLLAGDRQDGTPRAQLIVMPSIMPRV